MKVRSTMLVSMSDFMTISFKKKINIKKDYDRCIVQPLLETVIMLRGKTDVKSFFGSNRINSITFTMLL